MTRVKYEQSEKCKATRAKYRQSENGKAAHAKYDQTEKGKTSKEKYAQSEKGKASRAKYDQSEKGKAAHRRYKHRRRVVLQDSPFPTDFVLADKCWICGSTEKLEVDHIIPVARGGTNEPSNLTTLCKIHNLSKSAKTYAEWLVPECRLFKILPIKQ